MTLLLALGLALVASASSAFAAETHQHDAMGRLTDIAYANGGSLHYTYDANGNVLTVVTSLATAVADAAAPLRFALGPTTPNPAGDVGTVSFTLPARGHVALRAFDVAGRNTATLVDRDLGAGKHVVRFLTDRWASGVYFYRLQWAGQVRSGRFVVIRR